MYVRHLSLADFRSYVTAEVTFAPGVTTLVGTNGQGKTNLVEAIGYLASLSSHRVAQDAPLVRYGAERAVARGSVMRRVGSDEREALIELEIVPGRANRARLNRNPVARPREVLGTLRTVLFAPEDLALVKGDPSERRRFLDDLLVARQPRWAGVRSDYERILKQRNALLKSASQELRRSMGTRRRPSERDRPQGLSTALPTGEASAGEVSSGVPAVLSAIDTLDVWDDHLATVGAQLLYARLRLVRDLGPLLAQAYAAVADTGAPGESGALGDGGGGGPAAGSGDGAPPATDGQGPVAAEAGAGQGASAPGDPDPHSVARISYRSSLADDDAEVLSAALAGDAVPDPSELRALLLGSLARRRTAEIERGVTLVGPHRDELVCQLGDLPAKGYASHGESWSFALGLRLAAFHLLRRDLGDDPVLVLDDVFAELDSGRRERLAALIESSEQVIITAAVPEDIPTRLRGARFRVTRGFIAAESPTEPASESEPAPMAPSVEEPPVARGDPGAGAPVLGGERGDRTQAGDEHD